MTLSPGYRMDNGKMVRARTSRNAHVAVTQYQVLSSTLSSALLELQPITGEGPLLCSGIGGTAKPQGRSALSGALCWTLPFF